MRRVRTKAFDTERGAEQHARKFDYARDFNRLPPLEVEQDEDDGRWWIVNPDADAPARKPRVSRTPVALLARVRTPVL